MAMLTQANPYVGEPNKKQKYLVDTTSYSYVETHFYVPKPEVAQQPCLEP